ncbi:hypothetical protein DFS34DRAFT_654974 [Phlyctochytrium arcticum]|nr:hypothetical protein DFS34DRAFT_654974 [Phlyctochytrium arcticum]
MNQSVISHEQIFEHPSTGRPHFLEFIDVAGTTKHRASRSLFYSHIHGLVLVYDTTNKKSYHNLWKWVVEVFNSGQLRSGRGDSGSSPVSWEGPVGRDFELDVRVGDMRPTIPVLVVGTKSDLADEAALRRRSSLAEEYNAECVTMSNTQPLSFNPSSDRIDSFFSSVLDSKSQNLHGPSSLSSTSATPTSFGSGSQGNLLYGSGSSLNVAGGGGGHLHPHAGFGGAGMGSAHLNTATPDVQRRRIPPSGSHHVGAGGGLNVGIKSGMRPGSPGRSSISAQGSSGSNSMLNVGPPRCWGGQFDRG